MSAGELNDLPGLFAALAGFRRVGLAVSGGPDSLALMLLYDRWRTADPTAPDAIVYSVDHGLRPEAAAEVAQVLGQARRLGLRARGLSWEGPRPATGVQAAARVARYGLIADAMAADGAEALATAHNLEDQAETVLMRLAHGSGIEGLKGMRPVTEVAGLLIVRPLLGTSRADLAAVVADAGLAPVIDPSNADRHYERVRWRQALPQLAELGLTPARLALFAARMADADAALAGMAAVLRATIVDPSPDGGVRLDRDALLRQDRAIGVRLLAALLDEIGGGAKPHDLGAVEVLHQRLITIKPVKPTTLHGCIVSCDGETVAIGREPGRKTMRTRRRTEPMAT